jgi:hypothetical protein
MPQPPGVRVRLAQIVEQLKCRAVDSAILTVLDLDRDFAAIERAEAEAPYGRDPRQVRA